MTRTREDTTSPLVQRVIASGQLVPTGRQFSDVPRTDGLNHFGCTDDEWCAYSIAEAKLLGGEPLNYVAISETVGIGLNSTMSAAERAEKVAAWRNVHPLPTSFAPLAPGDPCLFVEPAELAAAVPQEATGAPATLERLPDVPETPAPAPIAVEVPVSAPSPVNPDTHVEVHVESVSAMHRLLDEAEHGASAAVHAIVREYRRIFPRAAA